MVTLITQLGYLLCRRPLTQRTANRTRSNSTTASSSQVRVEYTSTCTTLSYQHHQSALQCSQHAPRNFTFSTIQPSHSTPQSHQRILHTYRHLGKRHYTVHHHRNSATHSCQSSMNTAAAATSYQQHYSQVMIISNIFNIITANVTLNKYTSSDLA